MLALAYMSDAPAQTRPPLRPLNWIASSKRDLKRFSASVQEIMGYGLYLAQAGGSHESAKALKGFSGASVAEIRADDTGGTFRAVYTVKFARAVYVLHVFQKKSVKGIETSKADVELIRLRLKLAAKHYKETYEQTAKS
jgi:phage-related protein